MKHSIRSKITGRFIPRAAKTTTKPQFTIVPGRLYGYRGAVVRAGADTIRRNDKPVRRHVSFHKSLFGFVAERELQIIPREKVKEYLNHA